MAASPAYDVVLMNVRAVEFILTEGEGGDKLFWETINRLKQFGKTNGKATVLVMGEPETPDKWRRTAVRAARAELAAAGVAIYPDLDRAARSLGRYVHYLAERRDEK